MILNLLLVGAVALAALAASIVMVPRPAELALMLLRSGNLDAAQTLLEQTLDDGNVTAATIRPLVDVYLANGEPERAINVLGLFVADNSDDPKALALLAELQRQVNRFDDYADTLFRHYRASGDATVLRDYADLAAFRDDRQARRRALRELVKVGAAEPEEHVELARYLTRDGDPAGGLDALDALARAHPREVDDTVIGLYSSLAAAAGATPRLQAMLLAWLRGSTEITADDAEAALDGITRRFGTTATQTIIAAADQEPALAARYAEGFAAIEAKTGLPDAALARLGAQPTLSQSGRRLQFDVALAAGRIDLATAALESLTDLAPADLLALLESMPQDRRVGLGRRVLDRIDAAALAGDPLLAARLAFVLDDRAGALRWLERVGADGRSFEERLVLAQLLLQLERTGPGLAVLAAIADDPRLPPESFGDLAEAYRRLERQAEGAARLAAIRAARPGLPLLDIAWARLAAAAGDSDAVLAWLQQSSVTDIQLLTDLYYAGSDRNQWPLALAAATRLAALRPTPEHVVLQARALLALKRPREALPLLAALPPTTADVALLSIDAARQTGSDATAIVTAALAQPRQNAATRRDIIGTLTDPALRLAAPAPAIVGAVEADLDAGDLDAAARRGRLELLARLAPAAALPRWKAEAAGGDRGIGDGYLDLLVRLNRRDEAVTFLAARMSRGAGRAEAEADLYALLDIGGEQRALPYLKQAAERWGEGWQSAYEDALEKLGRRDELVALLDAAAGNERRTVAERRAAGFRLLDLGARRQAEAAFRQLAEREGPGGENVQQLLYLWGPRPRREGLDWLEARAAAARGADQLRWLQLLQDHGGGERMAALLARDEAVLRDPARLGLLVGHLVERRRLGEAEDWLLRAGAAAGRDGNGIATLLDRAEEFGLARAVTGLARLLAAADPGDREATRRLAEAAFAAGRRSEALPLYRRYLESGPGTWQSHYNFGELLLSSQQRGPAAEQYRRALAIIDRQTRPSAEAVRARMFLLGRLGRLEEMDRAIADQLRARPNDVELRTDLAGLLIDLGRLDDAERILQP